MHFHVEMQLLFNHNFGGFRRDQFGRDKNAAIHHHCYDGEWPAFAF
jgi:hypothetical protein